MFGGFGHDDEATRTPRVLNDMWLWNATTGAWTLVRQGRHGATGKIRLKPPARQGATACGVTGIMFILFGGVGPRGKTLYDTWIFDLKSSRWLPLYVHTARQRVKMTHPPGRSHAAGWCTTDSLVVFGGHDRANQLNDTWTLSLRTLLWVQILDGSSVDGESSDHVFPVSRSGTTTWTRSDGSLYLFGGLKNRQLMQRRTFDAADLLADLWLLSLHNASWTLVHTGSPSKLGAHRNIGVSESPGRRRRCASWYDKNNNLWLFGGEGISDAVADATTRSQLLSDVWLFNVTQKEWVCRSRGTPHDDVYAHQGARQVVSPTGRREPTAWQYNNVIYIMGGFGYDGRHKLSYLNDMWLHLRANASIPCGTLQLGHHKMRDVDELSGGVVFVISLSTFGGAVLVMGLYCFVKNIGNLQIFRKPTRYNVIYSPISDDAQLGI